MHQLDRRVGAIASLFSLPNQLLDKRQQLLRCDRVAVPIEHHPLAGGQRLVVARKVVVSGMARIDRRIERPKQTADDLARFANRTSVLPLNDLAAIQGGFQTTQRIERKVGRDLRQISREMREVDGHELTPDNNEEEVNQVGSLIEIVPDFSLLSKLICQHNTLLVMHLRMLILSIECFKCRCLQRVNFCQTTPLSESFGRNSKRYLLPYQSLRTPVAGVAAGVSKFVTAGLETVAVLD